MANNNVGFIALAVAILIATIAIAYSHRYQAVGAAPYIYVVDSWTGKAEAAQVDEHERVHQ